MTQQEPDEIRSDNKIRRQLKAEATPGKWACGNAPEEPDTWLIGANGLLFIRVVGSPEHNAIHDVALIVNARNSDVEGVVDKLIEQVQELLVLKHILSDIKSEEGRAFELGRIDERVKSLQTIAEMQFMYDATKIEQNDQRVVGKVAIAVFAEHVKEAIRKQP